ncbi:MAG: hypothetical protein ACWA40_09865 [Planktomarina sp.]
MVKIENGDDVERFIKNLPEDRRVDVATALASRVALRVLPFWEDDADSRARSVLLSLRAVLIPSAHCACNVLEVKNNLRSTVIRVTDVFASAASAIYASAAAAASASPAASAIYAATTVFTSASSYSSAGKVTAAAYATTRLIYSQVQNDVERLDVVISSIFTHSLWSDENFTRYPEIIPAYYDLLTYFDSDPETWSFWRRWFVGMWNGSPMDWDLPTQVALIPDEDWQKGAAHIAGEIAKIEARMAAAGERKIDPAPVSKTRTQKIIQNAPIVQISMEQMSHTITARLDLFDRMEKPNERIAFKETLAQMPSTADTIAQLLAEGGKTSEVLLAKKVGRLQALVEQLQRDLVAAHKQIADLKDKPRWWRSASGLGVAITAAVGGLWVLSGDDKRLEDRFNSLAKDWTFLESKLWPTPEDRIEEPLKYELPDSWDT